jgi:hypothetical protein
MPGPHDLAVRSDLSLPPRPASVPPPKFCREALKRRPSARDRITDGKAALRSLPRDDAAASTASHPASVAIAIRPFVGETGVIKEVIGGKKQEKFPKIIIIQISAL